MMNNKITRTFSVFLAALIVFAFSVATTAEVSAASGPVKMKAYDEVLKKGNIVYCASSSGLYKVNLKNGKAKRLVKFLPGHGAIRSLRKKGKYIYYLRYGPVEIGVCRIKTSGGKEQFLYCGDYRKGKSVESYVISGKKIYFKCRNNKCKVMNLNGKSWKKTSKIPEMIRKDTNMEGWRITEKRKGDYVTTYLDTPNKRIKVSKVRTW